MSDTSLVYVGKVIDIQPIPDADLIMSATVICGEGGKWRGVVRKVDFEIGSMCLVYLSDALVPQSEHMKFMKDSGWRVKMRRFKGAPSEVVIMPIPISMPMDWAVGDDLTAWVGVTKYYKPIPAHLQGKAKGYFPDFIPKTDEPNYQREAHLVKKLAQKPWYMTEKCDGSSTTAYRYKGNFGLCSRNLELEKDDNNGYWKVAMKYDLENVLPEGIAVQWETCGPGIQKNPMDLPDIDGFIFSGYNIEEKRYLTFRELVALSIQLKFPMAKILEWGNSFVEFGLEHRGEGTYASGKQREGVVIRSQENWENDAPISFKVINLGYEK